MSFIRFDPIVLSLQDLLEGDLKLATPPEIYARLRRMLAEPDVSMVNIAEVIEADPALSIRVLKLANSAFFSLPGQVASILEAIRYVGIQHVQDIVLATEVMQRFDAIPTELVDIYSFWRDSIRCAVLSRQLAGSISGTPMHEQMFLAGLLHRIGHLVMYQRIPELARKALLEHRCRQLPIYEVERDLMGFDHAQLGAALAQQWQLPKLLCSVIAHQHSPQSDQDYPDASAMLALAIQISEIGSFDGTAIDTGLAQQPELLLGSGLAPEALPLVLKKAERDYEASLALLY